MKKVFFELVVTGILFAIFGNLPMCKFLAQIVLDKMHL